MPPMALNKNKNAGTVDKVTDNNTNNTVTHSTAHKNSSNLIIEEQQDFNDATKGRKYLEKLSLICPPGEPATTNLFQPAFTKYQHSQESRNQ